MHVFAIEKEIFMECMVLS